MASPRQVDISIRLGYRGCSGSMKRSLAGILIPVFVALAGLVSVVLWAIAGPEVAIDLRMPGIDGAPAVPPARIAPRPVPGQPVRGEGRPSAISAAWPCFRGPDRDAVSKETVRLARRWLAEGPRRLWSVPLGKGLPPPPSAADASTCSIT